MCMNHGKKGGGVCLSRSVIRALGLAMIIIGVLVIVAFIPLRYWMALMGLALLAAGIALRAMF